MLLDKKVTHEMLTTIQIDKYQETLDQNNRLIYIDYGIGVKLPRVIASINSSDKVIGFLCVLFKNHPYHKDHNEIIYAIADAFSMYIREQTFHELGIMGTRKHIIQEAFKSNTLDHTILQQLKSIHLKDQYYRIGVTSIFSNYNQIVYLNQFMKYLDTHTHALSCIIEDTLYVLFPTKSDNKHEFIELLCEYLKASNIFTLHFGLSNTFTSLDSLPIYRTQAMHAFSFSKSKHCFFSDIVLQDFNTTLSRIGELSIYKHPLIHKLKLYDQKNNTEFLLTLKIYILSMNNTASTTQSLNIHRNTLLYRLSKIEELGNIDLKNNYTCNHLLLSFYLESNMTLNL